MNKKSIIEAPFMIDIRKICALYNKGWNERNGI